MAQIYGVLEPGGLIAERVRLLLHGDVCPAKYMQASDSPFLPGCWPCWLVRALEHDSKLGYCVQIGLERGSIPQRDVSNDGMIHLASFAIEQAAYLYLYWKDDTILLPVEPLLR